ncbi:MAG: hypothetical protein ACW981_07465 [Candidatus Hodarchaeales archaeon]|jgi:hypothetical protein
MTTTLSNNEKVVFELVFKDHDPDIKTLCTLLQNKLTDKYGNIVQEEPDTRFVSKLKSTGLKKITKSLLEIANSLRLDIEEPKKYDQKIKACISGLNFMLNAKSFLIYTLTEGPIVWYVHESNSCDQCVVGGKCEQILEIIERERNLILPKEVRKLQTDKKAEWIFQEILK